MKASIVRTLAASVLAVAPIAAQSLVFSSFSDVKEDDCGGDLGSSNFAENILDMVDDDGRYTSDCASTSAPMSCMALAPQNYTGNDWCVINVFSDEACRTSFGQIPVHANPAQGLAKNGDKWKSLTLQCDIEFFSTEDFFDAAIQAGKDRWNTLQQKLKESEPKDREGGDELLKDYIERFPNGEAKVQPPQDLRDELKALGTDTGSEYYDVELMGKNNNRVVFGDEYSVSQGVIIAENNDRRDDDRPKEKQLDLSEALFWEYKKLADNENPKEDIKKMRFHFRYTIGNKQTKDVIDEIYKREKKDRETIPLEYEPESDFFFALLGTPNGKATPFMLTDHPVALGKKNIKKAKIMSGRKYNMYFTIE